MGPAVTHEDCGEAGHRGTEPEEHPRVTGSEGEPSLQQAPDEPPEAAVTEHRGQEGAGGLNNDRKGKKGSKQSNREVPELGKTEALLHKVSLQAGVGCGVRAGEELRLAPSAPRTPWLGNHAVRVCAGGPRAEARASGLSLQYKRELSRLQRHYMQHDGSCYATKKKPSLNKLIQLSSNYTIPYSTKQQQNLAHPASCSLLFPISQRSKTSRVKTQS